MNEFERKQLKFIKIQILILFLTLLAAIFIGYRQNDINQQLVNIEFTPSVALTASNDQLLIHNYGDNNVWFFGSETEGLPKHITDEPRLIPPGMRYYIPIKEFKEFVKEQIGPSGSKNISILLFIKSAHGREYTVYNNLYCEIKNETLFINPQTINISASKWSF